MVSPLIHANVPITSERFVRHGDPTKTEILASQSDRSKQNYQQKFNLTKVPKYTHRMPCILGH